MGLSAWRRRRLIISPVQHKLMLMNAMYFVAFILLMAVALFWPLSQSLNEETSEFVRSELGRVILLLHKRFWPAALAIFALALVHAAVISHRIAGPLHRMITDMKEVGEGNLAKRIRLRKNDYLKEEADILNGVIDNLEGLVADVQIEQREVAVMADAAREDGPRDCARDPMRAAIRSWSF